MIKRIPPVAIHLLGGLLFLALPYLFAEDGFAKLADLPFDSHEQRNVFSFLLTIVFFYANYYFLIPKLFFNKKYVLYGISALSCFLLIQTVLVAVNQRNSEPPQRPLAFPPPSRWQDRPPYQERLHHPFPKEDRPRLPPPDQARQWGPRPRPGLPSELSQTFFLTLAGFLTSLMLRINSRWRETEQEKTHSELSFLKSQINPHFLFNTLNSIYSLAITESPTTANALVKLSSFLRYIIQESQKHQVSLRTELDYLDQYITLQKLRLADTVQITFSLQGQANGKQIVPLILISFIENAFKYGVSPQEPSVITIAITVHGAELTCHVGNQKVRVYQPMAVGSGVGLANTKARLKLLYPGRHRLVITDTPDTFTVDLSLNLS